MCASHSSGLCKGALPLCDIKTGKSIETSQMGTKKASSGLNDCFDAELLLSLLCTKSGVTRKQLPAGVSDRIEPTARAIAPIQYIQTLKYYLAVLCKHHHRCTRQQQQCRCDGCEAGGMSIGGNAHVLHIAVVALLFFFSAEAQFQRPSAAYAPLYSEWHSTALL